MTASNEALELIGDLVGQIWVGYSEEFRYRATQRFAAKLDAFRAAGSEAEVRKAVQDECLAIAAIVKDYEIHSQRADREARPFEWLHDLHDELAARAQQEAG